MRRLLITLALLCVPAARANDVYISQAGGGAGSSCGSTLSAAYFNNAANWTTGIPTGTQIGPITIVHLCGTFIGTANSTMLTPQGSGSAGSPVTIKFESGAVLQAPYWNYANGAIECNAKNFITIDGGTNGIIQNTADGTALANQQISKAINADLCDNLTIKNLTISNIYVRTSGSTTDSVDSACVVASSGNNFRFTNNSLNNCRTALAASNITASTTKTNTEIDHNLLTDTAVAIQTAAASGAGTAILSGVYIHDNELLGSGNNRWDSGASNFWHIDQLHSFIQTAGDQVAGLHIYDNYFHGIWTGSGVNFTGLIFIEVTGTGNTNYIFNNVFDLSQGQPGNNPGNGAIGCKSAGPCAIYNNTFIHATNDANSIVCTGGLGGNIAKNNIFDDTNGGFLTSPCVWAAAGADYNLYYLMQHWYNGGGGFTTFPTWNAQGFDTHGICTPGSPAGAGVCGTSDPKLNGNYTLQASSPAIAAGTNLNAICAGKPNPGLGALCIDKAGIARPTSAAWDMGAFQSAASAPPVLGFAPSPLNFGSVIQGTPTVKTETVSNIGGSTETLGSSPHYYTITGANAADFTVTGGSLTDGGTILANSSGTSSITWTPATCGVSTGCLETATLTIVGTVVTNNTVTLTGIGFPIPVQPAPSTPSIILGYSGSNMTLNVKNATKCAVSCTILLACQPAVFGPVCTGTIQ